MAFTTCSVATNNIASLDDLPNDVGGLTSTQLKEMFDKYGADFVAWFNATHIVEADAHLNDSAPHSGATPEFNGVKFPATQVPSSDINTLDDYEEGTWTANFICSTSGTITISDSFKTGSYTKIGRQVTVTGIFLVDSVSSPVGTLSITGLPFTSGNGNQFRAAVTVFVTGLTSGATTGIQGRISANSNTIDLFLYTAGTLADLAGYVQTNANFTLSATYFV